LHPTSSGRFARAAVWALVLLFPLAYLPRLATTGPDRPQELPPAWAHVVVVTASRWPARIDLELPALAELERNASAPRQVYAPAASSAGSAASLWTGRWAANHGVVSNDLALAPGAWTLATALRESGARTAAFLQEPFVSATSVGGFELVHESAADDAGALGAAAAAFLRATEGRAAVWVHLAHAGPSGSDVDRALAALFAELDASGRRIDTLVIATGFGQDDPSAEGASAEEASDRRYRVPLWVELPSRLHAGAHGAGALSLVDLAGTLAEVLRLPRPDASRGQLPPQSRLALATPILKGAGRYEWLFVNEPDRTILRSGNWRVVGRGNPPRRDALSTSQTQDPTRDVGFAPAPAGVRADLERQFAELDTAVRAGAEVAIAAAVPEPWRGRAGW
jgi:arylsulfatase A-like enzyme